MEVAHRVEDLLKLLQDGIVSPDRLRQLRAVEVLERIGNPDAKKLLQSLTRGVPEAALTRESAAALPAFPDKGRFHCHPLAEHGLPRTGNNLGHTTGQRGQPLTGGRPLLRSW